MNGYNLFSYWDVKISREVGQMSKRILIAYATRAGSTAEVADAIGKKLSPSGIQVDVKPVKTVKNIGSYDAVILGTGIRAGQVYPEVKKILQKHKQALSSIPVAYFVVCMSLKDNNEATRKIASGYLDSLRSLLSPVDVGLFAGKMDYSKLGFLARIIVRRMAKVPEGDFRDWKAIEVWAANVLPKLEKKK